MQYTTYSRADFEQALEKGETIFERIIFDEAIHLGDHFENELSFIRCRFTASFSLNSGFFEKHLHMHKCHFEENVDFAHATFKDYVYIKNTVFNSRANFERADFQSNVNFYGSTFGGETYFNHTYFSQEASFYKVRFLDNVYFHRSYMGVRADFSYVSFSPERTVSFFSILDSFNPPHGGPSVVKPPIFVFRYVYFPRQTLFTNVDLSKSIFQDCYIIPIIFKNCRYAKLGDRDCFYQEQAKHVSLNIASGDFDSIACGDDRLTVQLDTEEYHDLQIGDQITFFNEEEKTQSFKGFITWIYRGESVEELFSELSERMSHKDFSHYQEKLIDSYGIHNVAAEGLVAVVFKHFDERRHWENLEDINRQMKRSLEDSRDWQRAGWFYAGEMNAMTQKLKVLGERPLYRVFMQAYGLMAGYCESVQRILAHMLVSFSVSILVLFSFAEDTFSFTELLEYNLGLFIPLLGGKTITLSELGLEPWQNIVMFIFIIWYYMLWFFLALTLQRKFRR